jgi:uncharacterized membrane protein YdbT with pleckstrin-like domain
VTSMSDYLRRLLGEREEIILVTRPHWFVLVQHIMLEIVLALVIVAIIIVFRVFIPDQPLALLGFLLVIIPLVSLARDTIIWSNHKYIVTNRRVIQISGVFNKNVIDSSLEKVNDVKLAQSFLGRLFNYGDVEILTASELGTNLFSMIGDPVRFKTAMINSKEELERGTIPTAAAAPMDIPALISRLGELRDRGLISPQEFEHKKADLLTKI